MLLTNSKHKVQNLDDNSPKNKLLFYFKKKNSRFNKNKFAKSQILRKCIAKLFLNV